MQGTKLQIGLPLRLVGEVRRTGAGGEAGNPVATSNRSVIAQHKNFEIHSHSGGIDGETGRHAHTTGINTDQVEQISVTS
jgi:hypothetical protein